MEMKERENLPRRYYPRYRVKPHPSPVTKIQNVDAKLPLNFSLSRIPSTQWNDTEKNSTKLNNSFHIKHFRLKISELIDFYID